MNRRTRRPSRRGVTLLEALVAIFITAIGLLALLTLFPVGAMSMAQALKDDRCALVATQGDALMRMQWRLTVLGPVRVPGGIPTEMGLAAMDDPNLLERRLHTAASPMTPPGIPGQHRIRFLSDMPFSRTNDPYFLPAPITIPTAPVGPVSPTSLVVDVNAGSSLFPNSNTYDVTPVARTAVPSFPVLIDPIGYFGRRAADPERYWVGRSAPNLPTFPAPYGGYLLPRRSMLGITDTAGGQPAALAVFSLTDDLTFAENGSPDGRLPNGALNPNGAQLRRQGRYTWAAIVKRPRNDDLATGTLKIMVFDRRATLPPPGDEVMAPSVGTVTEGVRQITVDIPPRTAEQPVVVQRGGWVLDATVLPGPTGLQDPLSVRNDHFYRIVGVTEVGTGANGIRYVLDIDPPLRRPTVAPGATLPIPFNYNAQFYFFANLAEVFERPMLRPDAEVIGN